MSDCWIELAHGGKLDFLAPKHSDIRISDIAAATAKLCRYTGHCSRFYSVAEHCIHVASLLPPELAMFGLLHDAQEAYVGDVNYPLKTQLERYREIEDEVQCLVFRAFCGRQPTYEECVAIKQVDINMMFTECAVLMRSGARTWRGWSEERVLRHVTIECMAWQDAERNYLAAFETYANRRTA
jgi:hypothetical protein